MALFRPGEKQIRENIGKWSVVVSEDMCKACRFCIDICPVDVFAWRKKPNKIGWVPVYVNHEVNCIGCMLCYQVCPDFCINVERKEPRPRRDREAAVVAAGREDGHAS